MPPRRLACLVALLAGLSPAQSQSQPPEAGPAAWADPGLTVRRGLALWLDAGRLNAARKARGLPELIDGARVDVWHDASGRGLDVSQPIEKARPTYLDGAVRFDGESTHLAAAVTGLKLGGFTLFVVAAPLSNAGGFRGFVSAHQSSRDDYTSGLNVDLGPGYSGRLDTLNIEGKGFGGSQNLLTGPTDFGVVRRFVVTSDPKSGGTSLTVDGQPAGSRGRDDTVLEPDRLLVGARFFGIPRAVAGHLDGDLMQVLLYDRVLDESERRAVDQYLAGRVGAAVRPLRPRPGKPLVAVPDPPPVQTLAPGFTARELPVDLPNVNNLRYRPDGQLVVLRYDGSIDRLSDRDGDGLEETVEPFWVDTGALVGPIGMALTPPGYRLGDGVFVASKGRLSLVLDADRDGRAERLLVVATGWEPLPHGVDALGVALDGDQNVYFGLGSIDFTNPYLLKDGRAGYRLDDPHGTIQKVSADFSRREIVATGVRFSVGLAFNRLGDLFATDQEGATWLPNGNPFDELLHVQAGRHYGFPPRHPSHLPTVIDEPSVFDYGPQHQSTCGLVFNEPVNGGPTFGPAWWASDALLTGYSRGKLFRTKLVRTPAGYVGQTQLLAVLDRLTADACVSPAGDLVVATHGGLPDWGTGPKGKGRLLKVHQADRAVPRPVLAWAAGPREVRVAFDRPLGLDRPQGLSAKGVTIEYGQAVRPGDRFESLRPGYEVVGRQMAAPRFELPVLSTAVAADQRTLVLTTAAHTEASSHAITLAGRYDAREGQAAADVDLGYDLTGVDAAWQPSDGDPAWAWSGWLPHPDLAVARAFTTASAEHDRLWRALERPGRLVLKFQLDLWQMLRPAAQPGSDPGYRLPDEEVVVTIETNGPADVRSGSARAARESGPSGTHRARLTFSPRARTLAPVEVVVDAPGAPTLALSWSTREDSRPRALPLRRALLPWARLERRDEALAPLDRPELKGGDWARGREVFHGALARCSTCHAVRGRGGDVGPDLSNLVHRDHASVVRDIREPSAAVNPDHVAYAVALRDGRVLQGTLQTEGDRLVVADQQAKRTSVGRAEVEELVPSSVSIMPEGLDTSLGPDRLRDLLTFLLTDPLAPARLEPTGAPPPPPRRRAELEAALKGSAPVENPRRLRLVLSSGPKDHGPGEHDYPLWRDRWSALFATDPAVAVETAEGWPSEKRLETADVVVMYSNNPGWDGAKAAGLDRFLERGGGLVLVHYAVDGHQAVDALAARVGLAWQGGKSAFRHGPLEVDFTGSKHPIARGFGRLGLVDESYWDLVGDPGAVEVLGTGVENGQPRPLFWTRQVGRGRVFVSIPGHYTWTFDDPLFRLLLLRGIAWTAGAPVDRFNELTTLGARIGE